MTQRVAAPALPQGWPMVRTLGGIGILCALFIVVTFQATLPIIEQNKAEALERAIFHVLPGATARATFQIAADGQLRPFAGTPVGGGRLVYVGYGADGAVAGVAVEGAGQGFQDVIRLLYGYAPDRGQVIGLEVLESRETPGLGDKIIADPAFLANFAALDVTLTPDGAGLVHEVVAVKSGRKVHPWQIDGITGATISSVAVAAILQRSAASTLPILVRHADQLQKGPP